MLVIRTYLENGLIVDHDIEPVMHQELGYNGCLQAVIEACWAEYPSTYVVLIEWVCN